MKTISVILENKEIKDKLLLDLASLGYGVSYKNSDNADVVIADLKGINSVEKNDSSALIILIESQNSENLNYKLISKSDEVVFVPYNKEELEARIKLALAKKGILESKSSEDKLTIDGLTINFDSYEVLSDNKPLDLTYKEYELLKCLITKRGRVFTRDQLLNAVWGYNYYGGSRTVDVHIRRLRAKLGRHESLIETVRNVGYRFKR